MKNVDYPLINCLIPELFDGQLRKSKVIIWLFLKKSKLTFKREGDFLNDGPIRF